MSFKSLRIAAAVAATLACGQAAQAEGLEYNFSGFGTLGYVSSNTDTAAFRNGARQDKGATDSSGSWEVDSRIGLQANVKFNETFSAVGQVLAIRRDGEFAPTVEWLYGQAKVTDWADVRVGRMVLPVFMVSDSRNVGYASHWLRAPQEVYGLYPASAFDGIQGVFRHNMADTNFTLQVSAGSSKADIFTANSATGYNIVSGTSDYKNIRSLNLVAEHGNWTARAGYTETGINFNPIQDAKDKFTGFGLQYDDGKLLVMSEYVMRRFSDDVFNKFFDSDAYYISTGYRFGEFMPFVSASTFKPKGIYYGTAETGHALAVGIRWDVMKNVALKAQIEQSKHNTNLLELSPAYDPNKTLRTISVGADFVF